MSRRYHVKACGVLRGGGRQEARGKDVMPSSCLHEEGVERVADGRSARPGRLGPGPWRLAGSTREAPGQGGRAWGNTAVAGDFFRFRRHGLAGVEDAAGPLIHPSGTAITAVKEEKRKQATWVILSRYGCRWEDAQLQWLGPGSGELQPAGRGSLPEICSHRL
jgi:hypothetical protein